MSDSIGDAEVEAWTCGHCHALTRVTHFYQDPAGIMQHRDFTLPLGTGMRRVDGPTDLSPEVAEDLTRRLDEFDAVRNRGAVEVWSIPLGRTKDR